MNISFVRRCARCGEDHESFETAAKAFERPVVDSDGSVWTHWISCPVTQDPILIRVLETESNERRSS